MGIFFREMEAGPLRRPGGCGQIDGRLWPSITVLYKFDLPLLIRKKMFFETSPIIEIVQFTSLSGFESGFSLRGPTLIVLFLSGVDQPPGR